MSKGKPAMPLTDAQLNKIEQRPAGPSPQREEDINDLVADARWHRAELAATRAELVRWSGLEPVSVYAPKGKDAP